jgi:type IV secretory pathway TraG/TraD family ATPase VirD4
MGVTGTGKSTLLARLVLHDITAGRGVVVIDPKTDLVDRILERIPPERLDDVVVLDPSSPTPVGVNPLAGVDPDLAADSVVSVFHSAWPGVVMRR